MARKYFSDQFLESRKEKLRRRRMFMKRAKAKIRLKQALYK